VAEKTMEDVGPVTLLVNNAGSVPGTGVIDIKDSKIVKTFEVYVLAHFWTIQMRKIYVLMILL
jgi:all-trans-retinol dehydrogenase (NAD+)